MCFLAVGTAYFFYKETIYHKNRYAVSHANNQLLIKKMEEVYNDKLETDKSNNELRNAIEKEKNNCFNWRENISNTNPVITLKRLHADRNKVR